MKKQSIYQHIIFHAIFAFPPVAEKVKYIGMKRSFWSVSSA
jgi:hypothetical protein